MKHPIINVQGSDGQSYAYVDNGEPMQGAMKDVYFSPDRSYVVAFFRDKQDANARERLENIVNRYRKSIFENVGGEYWKKLFCWPTAMVEHNGRVGVIVPAYPSPFFFRQGYNSGVHPSISIKGKEKQGKWFASAQFRCPQYKLHLDPSELGDRFKYFLICLQISRAVKRMHAAGLAHSDLSYKNVLIDPTGPSAILIDLDGLVVPGKYPPDVLGTPDFIAPEVMSTKDLPVSDGQRKLPSILTDRHALAVMIYMYLLYRHPLRGRRVNDLDSKKDEELTMGSRALFIEHPSDLSNRPDPARIKPTHLPWADVDRIPYTVAGPFLKTLFDKAFITGLHQPALRPTADEWEQALLKTIDLMQPCQNPACDQKWFTFDNSTKPVCPFCSTPYDGKLPVLNFYCRKPDGKFAYENHRLMVYNNQYLYRWHATRAVTPNERLTEEERKPVGYFVLQNNTWKLVNQNLPELFDVTRREDIPIGKSVDLVQDKHILLGKGNDFRLIMVQMVEK